MIIKNHLRVRISEISVDSGLYGSIKSHVRVLRRYREVFLDDTVIIGKIIGIIDFLNMRISRLRLVFGDFIIKLRVLLKTWFNLTFFALRYLVDPV